MAQSSSFERYVNRPVYVAQCKTSDKAAELNLGCLGIRARAGQRDPFAQTARRIIATAMRIERFQRDIARCRT